jgi:RHS repeat-associated protein
MRSLTSFLSSKAGFRMTQQAVKTTHFSILFGALSVLLALSVSCDCGPKPEPTPLPPESDAGTVSETDAGIRMPPGMTDAGFIPLKAPPLPPHDTLSFADSIEFLYTGPDAVQVGVAAGTIEKRRVSVLKGFVFDTEKKPLPGVKVTVLGKPEYGFTFSRENGAFDLAVNGGEALVLDFERSGLLPAQRTVSTQWNAFYHAPEVVLIPLDPVVTPVQFGKLEAQVASSSPQKDSAGERTTRVLFPSGTTATMTLPDGSKVPLSSGAFRATEYTVGERGPARMPGALPATSGYTYAVELSLDEALAAQATTVEFSRPVFVYVDNFRKFPVGDVVPVGFYARTEGRWKPSDNGRVIQVLDVVSGVATVDADGDGKADDAAMLEQLQFSEEEKQQLAKVYKPGAQLWRVPIKHLTPWDFNWPYGPPKGAREPRLPLPRQKGTAEEQDCQGGSIIGCQGQTLGENFLLSGTGGFLSYSSQRQRGYNGANTLNIPLADADPLPGIKEVTVEVNVAGQFAVFTRPYVPNAVLEYVWDGKDEYGRPLQGRQTIRGRTGYIWKMQFYPTRGALANAWAFVTPNGQVGLASTSEESIITLWQDWETEIGQEKVDVAQFGGMTLSSHHRYAPESRRISMGDGGETKGKLGARRIRTIAGTGDPAEYLFNADKGMGGPATLAPIGQARQTLPLPDGSVLLAESCRIRKIDTKGNIQFFAGPRQTRPGFPPPFECVHSGDGGPALDAKFNTIFDLARMPEGSILVADREAARIRRIAPDGSISTFAGNGTQASTGDGGLASAASLNYPGAVAVDAQGVVYIGEYARIRRVGLDGVISTFAGDGTVKKPTDTGAALGDGGPARASTVSASQLSFFKDGSLLVADHVHARVRKIGIDGVISTVAGGGVVPDETGPAKLLSFVGSDKKSFLHTAVALPDNRFLVRAQATVLLVDTAGEATRLAGDGSYYLGGLQFFGENGHAASAKLTSFYDDHLAVGPSGAIYMPFGAVEKLMVVEPAFGAQTFDELAFASPSGDEIWVFNGKGRHLRTVDAVLGTTLLTFNYDANGLLMSVVDIDKKTLQFERDALGKLKAIVGPFGHRTGVTLDANGYVSALSNPLNETTRLTLSNGGLLTRMEDPLGRVHSYDYDQSGRLVKDTDPAGGFKSLTLDSLPTGSFQVVVKTAEGREEKYLQNVLGFGEAHQRTLANGTVVKRDWPNDGKSFRTSAAGTLTSSYERDDARFGLQAPYVGDTFVTVPSGLRAQVTRRNSVEFVGGISSQGIDTFTERSGLNGKEFVSKYESKTKTWTTISPEGRTTTAKLDDKGRVVATTFPGLEATALQYNALGQLTGVKQGARSAAFTYDVLGRVEKATDALGREALYRYNAANRLTGVTLPGGRVVGVGTDAVGNATSLTPPGKESHDMVYTPVNLKASETPPAPVAGAPRNVTRYAYNRDKTLTAVSLPGGQSIDIVHDVAQGRVTSVSLPERTVGFTYNTKGQVSQITATVGASVGLRYDGELVTGVNWSGARFGDVSYGYDADFKVTQVAVNNNAIGYGYDRDNLLAQAGDLTLDRRRDNGFLSGTRLNTVSDAFTYSGFGEMEGHVLSVGGAETYSEGLAFDVLGRIVSQVETVQGVKKTTVYGYDEAGRLSTVTVNGVEAGRYAYDANGNRVSAVENGVTTSGVYDGEDRLVSRGTATYAFSPRGQLVSKTDSGKTTQYVYDAVGALMAVTLPTGQKLEYVIDAAGRRMAKKVDGKVQRGWLYESSTRIAAETDAGGNVVSRFVYATQGNSPDVMLRLGVAYRLVKDHLGSVKLVIDSVSGEVKQKMEYDAWGRVTLDTNPGFQPFGFAGSLLDNDTKLTRFGARDYDAETGRWTAKDPLGFAAGDSNLYAYVGSSPQNWVDASGLERDLRTGWPRESAYGAQPEHPVDMSLWAPELVAGSAVAVLATSGLALLAEQALLGLLAGSLTSAEAVGAAGTAGAVGGQCMDAMGKARRAGKAGEDAVRAVTDLGSKVRIDVGDGFRVPDGINSTTRVLSEVKNVASQSYTQQLKDYAAYAQQNGLSFELWVRPTTQLTGPLLDATQPGGPIVLRYIP